MQRARKNKTAEFAPSNLAYSVPRSSLHLFLMWLLHWVSAVLIVFLLVTSITSGLGLTSRPFGFRWPEIHLSVGILILFLALARLVRASWSKQPRFLRTPSSFRRTIQLLLMAFSLILPLSGLLIFQQPPMSKPVQLFTVVPYSTTFNLEHSLHISLIRFHKIASYALPGVLLIHIAFAIIKPKANVKPPLLRMLWPWRRQNADQA